MDLRILVALLLIFTNGCQNIQEKMVVPLSSNEILFVRGHLYPPSYFELWAMDRNGGNQTRLLNTAPLEIAGVSWSPDGKKIAAIIYRMYSFPKIYEFLGLKKYVCEIWIIEIEKKKIIKKSILKIKKDIGSTFSWSPDSKKIAFTIDEIIYIIDSNGENLKQITKESSSSEAPSWSPDGKKIAFKHVTEKWWNIYMMDVNGTNIERVTNSPTYIREKGPVWFPDGKWIAFQEEDMEKKNKKNKVKIEEWGGVVLINLETKERKKLISLSASLFFIMRMCFSPDSKKLAFAVFDAKNRNDEICTIDIDGKNLKNLTNTPKWDEFYPSWRSICKGEPK